MLMSRNNLKKNEPMIIGVVGMAVYFGVGHFVALPGFLRGVLLGLTVACLILGAVVAKTGRERLQHWKKSFLQRLR